MDVQNFRKSLAAKIEENIRPLSTNMMSLRKTRTEQQQKNPVDPTVKKLQIDVAYKVLRTNSMIDHRSNVRIVTCLKAAEKCLEEYLDNSNKSGQIASAYLTRFTKISDKLIKQIDSLIIQGSYDQVKTTKQILLPIIHHLQKRARRYNEHQNEFKIISRKTEESNQDQDEQEDEIKEEMLDLVEKFKMYALNIHKELTDDKTVIDVIGKNQDQQISSLKNKNQTMGEIISEQKIGFIKLVAMGIIALVAWIFCMFVIMVV